MNDKRIQIVAEESFATRQAHFSHILEISESMLELAQQQEWEGLAEMETYRREHLERFFKTPVETKDAAWLQQGITLVLAIDKQLVNASEAARETIAQTRRGLDIKKAAAEAYGKS